MKALALEVFSKDEMGFINGGGDVTANKTIIISMQMVQQPSLQQRLRMMGLSSLTK